MFNVSKCKVMHLGHKNAGYSYYMHGKTLDAVEQEKDLGIIFSKDLKVSQQCLQAYAKSSRMLGAISRTIKFKDKLYSSQFVQIACETSLGILYFSMVPSLRQG